MPRPHISVVHQLLSTREKSCCIKTPRQQQNLPSSARCGASHIINRPRQTVPRFCKQTPPRTMKNQQGLPKRKPLLAGRATTEAARNSAENIRHSFPIQLPRLTGGSSLPLSQHFPQFISWSSKGQESGSTWFKYSRKRAQKEERVHWRLIEETNFKGSPFQRNVTAHSPAAQEILRFLLQLLKSP